MIAVETGDKAHGRRCPRAIVTVIYNDAQGHGGVREVLLGDPPAAGRRRQAEIGFARADLTRFDSNLDGSAPAEYRQAELCFNSMDDAQEGHRHARRSRRWATTSRKFATGGLDGPHRRARPSSLHLVILAAREGWHTRELTRALEARGHTGAIVPYEGLVAVDRAPARPPEPRGRARPGRRGARPHHPLRLARADHLPGGRPAPAGGPGRAGGELARAPSSARWTSSGPRPCSSSAACPRPRPIVCETPEEAFAALPRAGRRDREAAVRLDGPRHGAGERRGDGVPGLPDHRADPRRVLPPADHRPRRAATSGRSWWAVGCWPPSSGGPTGWRTNLARGGAARPSRCPRRGRRSALRAAAAVGAEYAGRGPAARRGTARSTCSR